MRVISGEAKGRQLLAVPGGGTRPITDRVKEALFNILGPDIEGSRFLDLFAGTGSVGIEALSRGAQQAVFVDKSFKAVSTVRKNLQLTGLQDGALVLHMDAFDYIRQAYPEERFDYVYVAPPQYKGLWAKALIALDERPLLADRGLVIIQVYPKEFQELAVTNLRLVDERHYGSTMLFFYEAGPAMSSAYQASAVLGNSDEGEAGDAG